MLTDELVAPCSRATMNKYDMPDLIYRWKDSHARMFLLVPVTSAGHHAFDAMFPRQPAVELYDYEIDPENPDSVVTKLEALGLYVWPWYPDHKRLT